MQGGYNLDSISSSALAVTKTLMGEAPPKIPETAATVKAVQTVQMVVQYQSKYWKCLHPKDPGWGQSDALQDRARLTCIDLDDFLEAEKLHGTHAHIRPKPDH